MLSEHRLENQVGLFQHFFKTRVRTFIFLYLKFCRSPAVQEVSREGKKDPARLLPTEKFAFALFSRAIRPRDFSCVLLEMTAAS